VESLVALVTLLTSDSTVMGTRTNSPLLRVAGWSTAAIMTFAAIAMLVTTAF
jgi:Mn2+/Fe2+ NRAMP family transporter